VLFRRSKPLHRQLAEAAHLSLDDDPPDLLSHPPGWDARSPVSEPAFHGIARPRRWEAIATAASPRLRAEIVHFVALPDGTLVVDEDEPSDAVALLADALEESLQPPYRAEAVRRPDGTWAVGASRITVVEEPALDGDEVELAVAGGARTLVVDGRPTPRRAPALEAIGEAAGAEYAVRGRRLDGALWEVEATPL
jgi:hypothetical protein